VVNVKKQEAAAVVRAEFAGVFVCRALGMRGSRLDFVALDDLALPSSSPRGCLF
jgi:hypothetical protein